VAASASTALAEARLPAGKTLANFHFGPSNVLESSGYAPDVLHAWVAKGSNSCCSPAAVRRQAIYRHRSGSALVRESMARMFARTTISCNSSKSLVASLATRSTIANLDRYDLLILDDITYVTKDQAENGVLVRVASPHVTSGDHADTANIHLRMGKIFPDQAMTRAPSIAWSITPDAGDEFESYRRREAPYRNRGRGRPHPPTIKKTENAED